VTYKVAVVKTILERIMVYPFVLLGKMLSQRFFLKSKYDLIIFSASADIGGSIQVNIDLCRCFPEKSILVIFSKRPKNNKFYSQFKDAGVETIDLHKYIDYKIYHFINFFYRGVIAAYINNIDKPIVVGGESIYFYKVLPFIKKEATCIDICHLNTWFNYSQAFIKDLDARVFSTKKIRHDIEILYQKNKIPEKYFSKLYFIDNKVDIPSYNKTKNTVLSVVYIGRGAPQKRVYLIAAIAKKMYQSNTNVHFSFVGDVDKVFDPNDYPYCSFYGNVTDKNRMKEIYSNSDVLLLTSAYEGLPIAVMQMMAYGKVVVSTAVDGIPDYIVNGENGFLIPNYIDEGKIVQDSILILNKLTNDRSLLDEIGEKSRWYAETHFSGETFCKEYNKVLFQN